MSDSIVIAPEGDVDFSRVDAFRTALVDAACGPQNRLVVDRSQVEPIDSSTLGVLVELYSLRRENRQLAMVGPRGTAVAVILNRSGLRVRLPTYDSPLALDTASAKTDTRVRLQDDRRTIVRVPSVTCATKGSRCASCLADHRPPGCACEPDAARAPRLRSVRRPDRAPRSCIGEGAIAAPADQPERGERDVRSRRVRTSASQPGPTSQARISSMEVS